MTVKDISNGPDWVIWVVFGIFALLTVIFLTGHGAGLVAGYNTAGPEEKARIDEKKMCRCMGFGMLAISAAILVMGLWEAVLPAWTAYVLLAVIVTDCLTMIVLINTVCKKK